MREKSCISCKKFPCGSANCTVTILEDCERYSEGGKNMADIIYDSLTELWEYNTREVKEKFNTGYGKYCITIDESTGFIELEIHTGGWSNNETLVNQLKDSMFWTFFWYESRRGGHYIFKKPYKKEKIIK